MKTLLNLLILVCPIFVSAQTCPSGLSGTFKVGPSGTYHSIQEALDSLKSKGLSQAVTLELQATYNSSVEAFPIRFPKIDCADSARTVTLRPEAGASSLVISGGNDSVLLDFNNGSWFVLDGRAGGVGTSKELEIINTNPNGSTIRIINDACFNSFRHLNIRGAAASYFNGTINIAGTELSRGNDSNRVDTCNIYDGLTTPANAIYMNGSFSKPNTGILINGCNIYNFFTTTTGFSNGIFIGQFTDSVVIANNRFYQTAPRNFSGPGTVYFSAIKTLTLFNGAFLIANNHIGGSGADNKMDLKGNFAFTPISISNGDGAAMESLVLNNVIENIRMESHSNLPMRMIELGCELGCMFGFTYTYNGNCTGNTVGTISADSSLIFKATGTSHTEFIGIAAPHPSKADSVKIKFNNIGGLYVPAESTNLYRLEGIVTGTLVSGNLNLWIEDNIIGSTGRKDNIVHKNGGEVYGMFISRSQFQNTIIVATRNKISNLSSYRVPGFGSVGIVYGILATGGFKGSQSLVNNEITHLTASVTTAQIPVVTGIFDFQAASDDAINAMILNKIYGLSSIERAREGGRHHVSGIYIEGHSNSKMKNIIARNNIHGLSLAPDGDQFNVVSGVFIDDATTNSTVENNMIRLGIDTLGNLLNESFCSYWGIGDYAGQNNYIHNSIFLAGNTTVAHDVNSSACLMSINPSQGRSIRNNIFVNHRTVNLPNYRRHAAIQLYAPFSTTNMSMDNNLYHVSGLGTIIGSINAMDASTIEEWKQISAKDSNALYADPKFINPLGSASTGNLHVALPSPIESKGSLSGTTIFDIDGDTRALSSPVDIGADAGQFGTLEPTNNGSNLQITNITGNSATISCTQGSGEKRLFVIRRDSAVYNFPSDGTSYNANSAFNQGSNLGNATYVIEDSGTSVTVTDLAPNTKYHVAIFEYNGSGQLTNYLTTGFLTGNFTTLTPTAVIDLQDPGFKVNISPNPTNNTVWLSVKSDRFTKLKISVYSQSGALLFQLNRNSSAGNSQIPLKEFTSLKPGTYIIQLQTDKSQGSTIIVKQ